MSEHKNKIAESLSQWARVAKDSRQPEAADLMTRAAIALFSGASDKNLAAELEIYAAFCEERPYHETLTHLLREASLSMSA